MRVGYILHMDIQTKNKMETLEQVKNQYIKAYLKEMRDKNLVPNDSFDLMTHALTDFVKQVKKNGYCLKKC